jgi:hyperosmotically inducible periplasmic protein
MIMNKINTRFLFPFLLLCVAVLTYACNSTPKDEEIQQNAMKQIKENKSFSGVNVSVKDGVATLAGTCEGENCAAEAEQVVAKVNGVKSVENNVQANVQTDLTLRTSVQTIVSKYEGVQADVAAGEVVLRGSIKREQIQPLMNELEQLKPKKIDNQLAVQ